MAVIHLDSHLIKRLEQIAAQKSMPLEQFLDEALTSYLRQIEAEELQADIQVLQEKLAELRQAYPEEYVAINRKELVDHDRDFLALHHRVRQRFGRQPVLIRRLEGERTWNFRSPHFDRASS